MSGNRVLSHPVTYAAMASVLKKSLAAINFTSDKIKSFGLHSFRIGAISAAVNSGKITTHQLQRAGRWTSSDMIGHYTHPSDNSNLLFPNLLVKTGAYSTLYIFDI